MSDTVITTNHEKSVEVIVARNSDGLNNERAQYKMDVAWIV